MPNLLHHAKPGERQNNGSMGQSLQDMSAGNPDHHERVERGMNSTHVDSTSSIPDILRPGFGGAGVDLRNADPNDWDWGLGGADVGHRSKGKGRKRDSEGNHVVAPNASSNAFSGTEINPSAATLTGAQKDQKSGDAADRGTRMHVQQAEADSTFARKVRAALKDCVYDCVICAESKKIADFPLLNATSQCDHPIQTCTDCLSAWLESELADKGHQSLTCPECSATLSHNQVKRAASPETFTLYDRLTAQSSFTDSPEFAWCLSPSCKSGQFNYDTPATHKDYMLCAACGYRQCLRHRGAWHEGETCEQFDVRAQAKSKTDEERATRAMLAASTKSCPGQCGWRIEKSDGCD